jgi:hypothetical protein
MVPEKLIPLAKPESRQVNLGPSCSCFLAAHGVDERPALPPAVRQMRGSLSLLVCSACGGLRRK